jgi:hypothetical protein
VTSVSQPDGPGTSNVEGQLSEGRGTVRTRMLICIYCKMLKTCKWNNAHIRKDHFFNVTNT